MLYMLIYTSLIKAYNYIIKLANVLILVVIFILIKDKLMSTYVSILR